MLSLSSHNTFLLIIPQVHARYWGTIRTCPHGAGKLVGWGPVREGKERRRKGGSKEWRKEEGEEDKQGRRRKGREERRKERGRELSLIHI